MYVRAVKLADSYYKSIHSNLKESFFKNNSSLLVLIHRKREKKLVIVTIANEKENNIIIKRVTCKEEFIFWQKNRKTEVKTRAGSRQFLQNILLIASVSSD